VKTPSTLTVVAFGTFAIVIWFSGCVLPYSEAGTTVFARISSSGRTNEYIVVVNRQHGWINLTTPEGPQYLSTSATKRHYYFYNRRWSGKSLSFLQGNDGVDWEVLEPIEDTPSWVRVEGRGRRCTLGGTNIAITLFTPRELLNQYTVQTRDIPDRECLRFTNGNRIVSYRSTADAFTFDTASKSLTKPERE
jgi:hypothetical protein